MKLTVETTGKGKARRTRIVGDPAGFFWLLSAAGSARDGYGGNEAQLAGGGVLELAPEDPRPDQPDRHKQRRSSVDATG